MSSSRLFARFSSSSSRQKTENHGGCIFPVRGTSSSQNWTRNQIRCNCVRVCQSHRSSREYPLDAGVDCATRSSQCGSAERRRRRWSLENEGGGGGTQRGRAARLSFLMSIGSDSLLNAAMISRSGRGRTRVSSLVHEIAIRYAVMLVGFSPPPTRRACDTRVVLRQKFARGI